MKNNQKKIQSGTVIKCADGPTSVFLLTHDKNKKEKNPFKRMKADFLQKKYERKRTRAKRSIVPGAHTIEETITYITKRYGAKEASPDYPHYRELMLNMKCGLIRQNKPELLSEKPILPPQNLQDSQAVAEWLRQVDEAVSEQHRTAESLSYETFPTDYHLFIIKQGTGTLTVELDTFYPVLNCSYSGGEKKQMDSIIKDIHLYYGVSQEDIDGQTPRYKDLLSILLHNA